MVDRCLELRREDITMDVYEARRVQISPTQTVTPFGSIRGLVLAYGILIGAAEAVVVFFNPLAGVIVHALLIVALMSQFAWYSKVPEQSYGDPGAPFWFVDALPILALLPLTRILSLSMPLGEVPQTYWYLIVGVPVLIAGGLTMRLLKLPLNSMRLQLPSWPRQALVGLTGIPLSLMAFLILRPDPLWPQFDWFQFAIGCVILMIFTGLTEEVIFRGMLQQVLVEMFGLKGIALSSTLFAVMYIGSLSPVYVLFVGLVGLFFGWCVNRTNSLWGVVLAHALLNVGMLLAWPYLWQ